MTEKMQHFHVIKLFEPVKDKELNIQEVKKLVESLMSPKEKKYGKIKSRYYVD